MLDLIHGNCHFAVLGMTTEPSDSDGYLDTVSAFIKFLTGNELTLDEILRNLVLVVFASINAEAISLRQLNNDNKAVRTATWGMPPEMILKPGDVYDFKDKYPSNDTLRFRRVTLINTLPDWGDEYPLLKDFPYTTGAKSCICFPIDKSGTPVAALCIFSRDVLYPSTKLAVFLSAVVARNSIDWITTIRRNMNYTLGEDEQEIFLPSGTPVRLTRVEFDEDGKWAELPIRNKNRKA